jgi:3-oxoacyl-(acyl-carrier-protein) synthase
MALAAALLALHDAELDVNLMSESMGLYVGTSLANLETTFAMRDRWQANGVLPAHAAFQTFPHSIACQVSALLDLRGPLHTTTSGCNSGVELSVSPCARFSPAPSTRCSSSASTAVVPGSSRH